MASFSFKKLPNQSNGRKRYSVAYDPMGRALPRKKPLDAKAMLTSLPHIIGPVYMPGGSDQKAPRLPGDRM